MRFWCVFAAALCAGCNTELSLETNDGGTKLPTDTLPDDPGDPGDPGGPDTTEEDPPSDRDASGDWEGPCEWGYTTGSYTGSYTSYTSSYTTTYPAPDMALSLTDDGGTLSGDGSLDRLDFGVEGERDGARISLTLDGGPFPMSIEGRLDGDILEIELNDDEYAFTIVDCALAR